MHNTTHPRPLVFIIPRRISCPPYFRVLQRLSPRKRPASVKETGSQLRQNKKGMSTEKRPEKGHSISGRIRDTHFHILSFPRKDKLLAQLKNVVPNSGLIHGSCSLVRSVTLRYNLTRLRTYRSLYIHVQFI